jgi:acetyltransferase
VAEINIEDRKQMVGIGRLTRILGTDCAQIKMAIIDDYHKQRLGTQLIHHLFAIAEKEKIHAVDAYILSENTGMLKICEKEGCIFTQEEDSEIIHAQKTFI